MRTLPDTIRLVVTDIDGTLVDHEKRITPRAHDAARRLRDAGIRLCLISARPPRGLDALVAELSLDTPRAGFNGGEILSHDGRILDALHVPETAARRAIEMLDANGIDAWVFSDGNWYVTNPDGPYVPLERRTVKMEPITVPDFDAVIGRAGKVMGSSADFATLERVELEISAALDGRVAAHRSQTYYLDITHPEARKDHGMKRLAALLEIPIDATAAIGDMGNDISMLEAAALSIAMGQASDDVRASADLATASNREDGWAEAMERFILPRAPRPH